MKKINIKIDGKQMDIHGQILSALVLKNYNGKTSISIEEIEKVEGYIVYIEKGMIVIEAQGEDND